jgi:hypothetical protein
MTQAFEEAYCGYRLKCEPQDSGDGRYFAFLAIAQGADVVRAAALEGPSFATAQEAAEASRIAGMSWVDAHDLASNSTVRVRRHASPAMAAG